MGLESWQAEKWTKCSLAGDTDKLKEIMMRIVAGDWRGRTIEAPSGETTRPTTDRVREALFSSLFSLLGGFEGSIVLDAFAGSGALGLEALSRGAARAVFYESDANTAESCRRNIRKLGADRDRATCVQRDVLKTPPSAQEPPFDLVFLDPPYRYDPSDVLGFVRGLVDAGVAREAVFVYEHAKNTTQEVAAAIAESGFEIISSRKYGKTGITVFE